MGKAEIIVLLISVDFINSKFCYEKEMSKALDRHSDGEARVVPIILRNCLWKHTPLQTLKALPEDGKPIASWEDEDDAMTLVAEGIRSVVADLRETA